MKYGSAIKAFIKKIEALIPGDYATPLSFTTIIRDTRLLTSINALFKTLDGESVTDVVLIGIGGSHFGVQAVYDVVCGSCSSKPAVVLHSLTSIQASYDLVRWYTALLDNPDKQVITCIVSKTGTTFETASHAALCLDILKKKYPATYKRKLCVITDEDSLLARVAQKDDLPYLSIPQKIGGRFSVFSAAGLMVLSLLRIDIQSLLAGAQSVDIIAPLNTAVSFFEYYQQGFLVHDIFIFMDSYAALGGWLRQLIGESLGKQGKGFLPTVSLGSQDLHSVVQYYFAGSLPMITSFLLPTYADDVTIPANDFSGCAGLVPGLSFNALQKALIEGLCQAYTDAKKPFFTHTFTVGSTYDSGAFMQYKMLEVVFIAILMGIDPFDQPHVELYKHQTRLLIQR